MGNNILIAEPRDILRIGLRAIFLEDPRVSNVYEAANEEGLKTQLLSLPFNLIVINQSMLVDIAAFPEGKVIILAAEPKMEVLKTAYRHRALGYLSENVSAELLRTMLEQPEGSFLVEPSLTPWMLKVAFNEAHLSVSEDLLTPREKEIVFLLREGLDRPTIARHLSIAETTLKTHIKNIARKRDKGGVLM